MKQKENTMERRHFFRFAVIGIVLFIVVLAWLKAHVPEISFAILSLASVAAAIISAKKFYKNVLKKSGQTLKTGLMSPVVFLLLSIWLLRFNVCIHMNLFAEEVIDGVEVTLNPAEHFLNSLVHALQSFSMDEDYTMFVTAGKAFILQYSGTFFKVLAMAYGAYCAILNILAPIAGGAIIFDILTNFFPGWRLRYKLYFYPKTESFVFSELNERSATLAESIAEKRNGFIVFSDVYASEDEEGPSELLSRMKKIGAICLKDDITILNRYNWGTVKYFLLDEEESHSIQSFAGLSETGEHTFLEKWKKSHSRISIYVFSKSALVDRMVERFNKLCSEEGAGLENVVARPIYTTEVLCYDILVQYPLYETIPEKKEGAIGEVRKLPILLVGNSPLICQFLKTAYWCGQLLEPSEINEKKPGRIIPEFHVVCKDIGDIQAFLDSEMPRAFEDAEASGFPYGTIRYYDKQLNRKELLEVINGKVSFNYCLVDTENDYNNIELGYMLRNLFAESYYSHSNDTMIICTVRNKDLNNVNEQLSMAGDNAHIHLKFAGSDAIQYEIGAIERTELEAEAYKIDQSHTAGSMRGIFENLYNYRSSMASALHFRYKLYSAGVGTNLEDPANCGSFLEKILGIDPRGSSPLEADTVSKAFADRRHTQDNLLWLEKIRWNAYEKSIGIREPRMKEIRSFFKENHTFRMHKPNGLCPEGLYLHNCLMDLKEPVSIVLNERWKKPEIKEAMEIVRTKFEEANDELLWPDFLMEELSDEAVASKLGKDVDILDLCSLINEFFTNKGALEDYKEYDFQQIPVVAADMMLSHLEQPDKARNRLEKGLELLLGYQPGERGGDQTRYKNQKGDEKLSCYLAPQLKNVLEHISK